MNTREELVPQKDVEALRTEVGKLRNELSAMADKVKGKAADLGQETYSKVRATAAAARQRAELASDKTSRAIEDRPLASVGVAFLIGVIVGVAIWAATPTRDEDC